MYWLKAEGTTEQPDTTVRSSAAPFIGLRTSTIYLLAHARDNGLRHRLVVGLARDADANDERGESRWTIPVTVTPSAWSAATLTRSRGAMHDSVRYRE